MLGASHWFIFQSSEILNVYACTSSIQRVNIYSVFGVRCNSNMYFFSSLCKHRLGQWRCAVRPTMTCSMDNEGVQCRHQQHLRRGGRDGTRRALLVQSVGHAKGAAPPPTIAASNLLYRQTGGRFICLPVSRSPTCRDAHDSSISLLQCTWAPFCSAYGRCCGRPPKTGAQFDVECHGVRVYVFDACYSPMLYSPLPYPGAQHSVLAISVLLRCTTV